MAAMRPEDPAPYEAEYRTVHRDGTVRWVFGKGRANFEQRAAGRQLASFDGTVADITDRKRIENELRDIRSRMEAALGAGAIGTWTWEVPTDRFFADQSLARIFSLAPEDVAGGPLARIVNAIHPDDQHRVADLVNRAVESGDRYEADYRVAKPDGSWRWVTAAG